MIDRLQKRKDNLMKTVRQMTEKEKRDLFRLDSRFLSLWNEASDKSRLEIIITVVAGFIAGIFIFLILLR